MKAVAPASPPPVLAHQVGPSRLRTWQLSACLDIGWLGVVVVALARHWDLPFFVGVSAGFMLALIPAYSTRGGLPVRPLVTAVLLPVAYAIDQQNGRFFFEFVGFRQPLGVGAGLVYALGFLGPRLWRSRLSLDRDVWLLVAAFVLLCASAFRVSENPDPLAQLFGVVLPLAGVGRFGVASIAVRGRTGIRGLAVLVVGVAVSGGLMRWVLEGPGASSSQFRAGVDWYVGPAVHASSTLLPALPLSAWLVFTAPSVRQRWIFIVASLVVVMEIIWSERKLAVLVVVLQAAVLVAVSRRRTRDASRRSSGLKHRPLLVGFSAVLIAGLASRVLALRLDTLYDGQAFGNTSDEGRLRAMRAFWRALLERPSGWGLDGIAHSVGLDGFYGAHNTLLGVAVDAGLVAGALVTWWWLSRLLALARRAARDATPDLAFLRVAALTALLILVLDGPDHAAHPLPSGTGLVLGLALTYAHRRPGLGVQRLSAAKPAQ